MHMPMQMEFWVPAGLGAFLVGGLIMYLAK